MTLSSGMTFERVVRSVVGYNDPECADLGLVRLCLSFSVRGARSVTVLPGWSTRMGRTVAPPAAASEPAMTRQSKAAANVLFALTDVADSEARRIRPSWHQRSRLGERSGCTLSARLSSADTSAMRQCSRMPSERSGVRVLRSLDRLRRERKLVGWNEADAARPGCGADEGEKEPGACQLREGCVDGFGGGAV
jgi:hypothetical protein